MKLTDSEITDSEITKKIEEIKKLHLAKRDEKAVAILDEFVQELSLLKPFNPLLAFLFSTNDPVKIYLLTGDIYSNMERNKEALEAYKLYHYYVQQLSPHENLESKSNAIVYSFRACSRYFLDDLKNRTITCVAPSEMNDPFDSIATYWSKEENLDKLTNLRKTNEIYSKSFEYYRIRSFVANRDKYETDDSILEKIKMWSHYADSHKGVCVKYKLTKHFIKPQGPYGRETDKDYICKVLRLYPMKYEPDVSLNNMKSISPTDIICRKSSVWSDENEVRLISYNPYSEKKWFAEPLEDSTIEEIIFGYKCSKEDRTKICNDAKALYPGIKFSEMYIDETKSLYKLMKKEYHK